MLPQILELGSYGLRLTSFRSCPSFPFPLLVLLYSHLIVEAIQRPSLRDLLI